MPVSICKGLLDVPLGAGLQTRQDHMVLLQAAHLSRRYAINQASCEPSAAHELHCMMTATRSCNSINKPSSTRSRSSKGEQVDACHINGSQACAVRRPTQVLQMPTDFNAQRFCISIIRAVLYTIMPSPEQTTILAIDEADCTILL